MPGNQRQWNKKREKQEILKILWGLLNAALPETSPVLGFSTTGTSDFPFCSSQCEQSLLFPTVANAAKSSTLSCFPQLQSNMGNPSPGSAPNLSTHLSRWPAPQEREPTRHRAPGVSLLFLHPSARRCCWNIRTGIPAPVHRDQAPRLLAQGALPSSDSWHSHPCPLPFNFNLSFSSLFIFSIWTYRCFSLKKEREEGRNKWTTLLLPEKSIYLPFLSFVS